VKDNMIKELGKVWDIMLNNASQVYWPSIFSKKARALEVLL
jgi:hypothetical protein